MMLVAPDALAKLCLDDGEFRLASRFWSGGVRLSEQLEDGSQRTTGVTLDNGLVLEGLPAAGGSGVIELSGPSSVWDKATAGIPPPFFNDISILAGRSLGLESDELTYWQYLPALQRLIELIRPQSTDTEAPANSKADVGSLPRHDAPTGRYVHLGLGDASAGASSDHRIYYEEAGRGIPLLLQHTAGSHGVQWRHLFEHPVITDHFRLIAYDLPFHGKSIPPVDQQWWAQEYRLQGSLLRSVPLALTDALSLDQPVFMGCSVGGLLALDLALHHPDRFRAVISLEGALRIGGDLKRLAGFWHPGVSNETKARMMEGLTAPTSPAAYRKETIQTYAAGWPPAFIGDLAYYCEEFDLRDRASEIDTANIGVHILSGEYDHSGSVAHGRTAHEAIPGSTFAEMSGVGHFPMSENPEAFFPHLLPVLDRIRGEAPHRERVSS